MEPELIIFDCDGVLIDSEPLALQVLLEELSRCGLTMSADEALGRFLGKSTASVVEILNEEYGLALDANALARMRERLFDLFKRELKAIPGVPEALERIPTRRCVASSSQPDRIAHSLKLVGLYDLFAPHMFSASMVARGKPAPDLFLHAARAMGAEPTKCLVVEDSTAGVEAARRAGMRAIGFTGGAHARAPAHRAALEAAGAERVIAEMPDLPNAIAGAPRTRTSELRRAHFIGVDVGSSSARAGVFSLEGALLGRDEHPIARRQPTPTGAEFQSEDIWRGVCQAVRSAVGAAGIEPATVAGVGFCGTCSLVARDKAGAPLSVAEDGGEGWDVMAWMDHRAIAEAAEWAAAAASLGAGGGAISPEMQTPKLMWLKRRLPERWAQIGHLFDLADFLTWRATGSSARSACTLTSKWAYANHDGIGWRRDLLASVGLDDLLGRGGLPEKATPVSQPVGSLSKAAAADLGLPAHCVVASGLIDAHSGMIGLLAGFEDPEDLEARAALITGTSSCIMRLSKRPYEHRGLWGPYRSVVLDDFWMTEGGQSAAGAALNHVLQTHSATADAGLETHRKVVERVQELLAAEGLGCGSEIDVLPDFHGMRSPRSDPGVRGIVSGLGLDASFDGLCRLYWRTAVGLGCGLRDILETMEQAGGPIEKIHLTGGHLRNPVLLEAYLNILNRPIVISDAPDTTLLGAALSAMVASGRRDSLIEALRRTEIGCRVHTPDPERVSAHQVDYEAYRLAVAHRSSLATLRARGSGG